MYAQSDTLLLSDVFENFRNICLEIYELDSVYFASAPGLELELELLTDYCKLLMVGNGTQNGICQATHRYAKASNKYMKNYDKSID